MITLCQDRRQMDLELANGHTLMYPDFCPPIGNASTWSQTHDPEAVMVMKHCVKCWMEKSFLQQVMPLSMDCGDESRSLRTSSIATWGNATETDLKNPADRFLKTDFFHAPAFPSYLLYNPYNTAQSITLDLGDAPLIFICPHREFILQTSLRKSNSQFLPDQARLLFLSCRCYNFLKDNKFTRRSSSLDYMQHGLAFNYHPGPNSRILNHA